LASYQNKPSPTYGAPTRRLASVNSQPTELAKSQSRKVVRATPTVLSTIAIKPVPTSCTATVSPRPVFNTPLPALTALVTTHPTALLEANALWV